MSIINEADLPTSSDDRLRRIAKIFRDQPELWNQGVWITEGLRGHYLPSDYAQTAPICGTPGCVAGWAIRLTPQTQFAEMVSNPSGWVHAARDVLELDDRMAWWLFSISRSNLTPEQMADALEHLADLDPSERTLELFEPWAVGRGLPGAEDIKVYLSALVALE